jgi:hypothetical protein
MGTLGKSQTLVLFARSFWNQAQHLPYQPARRRLAEHHRPTIRAPIPFQRQGLANPAESIRRRRRQARQSPQKKDRHPIPVKGKASE